MKITAKTDQDILAAVAGWALVKLQEDWDQPIVHDILGGIGIGPARDAVTDTKGAGAAKLEQVLRDFVVQHEKAKEKAAKDDRYNDRMREFFGTICNKDNWKMPINAVIKQEDEQLAIDAIVFMTGGGDITVTQSAEHKKKGLIRVKAPGYYASVGA